MNDPKNYSDWEDNKPQEYFELDIVDFFSDLPERSRFEEQLNAWSHGISALLAAVGFAYTFYLALNNTQEYAVISSIVYGSSLVLLFSASALYHNAEELLRKKKLRILDHCAIFLFIVGNYTPLLLLTVGGTNGIGILLMLSSAAFIGILLKMKFTGKFDWFFVLLYVLMAWVGIIQGHDILDKMPPTGFYLLLLGGFIYMIGILFYKAEGKVPYAHLFWHLFVMGGAFLHYIVMIRFVF